MRYQNVVALVQGCYAPPLSRFASGILTAVPACAVLTVLLFAEFAAAIAAVHVSSHRRYSLSLLSELVACTSQEKTKEKGTAEGYAEHCCY